MLLDGSASVGLPGRPVQQYSWEIRTAPSSLDPSLLVTAFGQQAQVLGGRKGEGGQAGA